MTWYPFRRKHRKACQEGNQPDYATPIVECVVCGVQFDLAVGHKCSEKAVREFDNRAKRLEARMEKEMSPQYDERLGDGFAMLDGEVWPTEKGETE